MERVLQIQGRIWGYIADTAALPASDSAAYELVNHPFSPRMVLYAALSLLLSISLGCEVFNPDHQIMTRIRTRLILASANVQRLLSEQKEKDTADEIADRRLSPEERMRIIEDAAKILCARTLSEEAFFRLWPHKKLNWYRKGAIFDR